MRLLFCLVLCVLAVGCAVSQPIPLPTQLQGGGAVAPDERLSFVAWYTTNDLDIPLQGVVRCVPSAQSGLRVERMGLVLAQGRTVGVTQWTAQGVRRQVATMPGAEQILTAVEQAVSTLAQRRGIEIIGETVGEKTVECTVLAQDESGPCELRCNPAGAIGKDKREHVTVRFLPEIRKKF